MTNPYQQQPAPQYGSAPQQPYPPQQQQPYPPQGQYQQQYPAQQQYPGQQYGQQPGWGAPQGGGVYQARFTRHTGMLLMWQQSRRTVSGSFEQVEQEYKAAQTHNLTAGWWSISSIIAFNWIAIFGNMYAFSKVKKAAGR